MRLKQFLQTWEGTQFENTWLRIFSATMLVIILFLMVLVFRKETIVTMQPFTLKSEAWVSQNDASQSYKKAWGMALAQLVGNVQPATVDFVKDTLSPILTPSIYQDVMDTLEVQALDIKKDRVVMRFEPRVIIYEPETDKVFVEGLSFVSGVSAKKESTSSRVYEFVIGVEGYMPELQYITTYEGRAKTQEALKKVRGNSKSANK